MNESFRVYRRRLSSTLIAKRRYKGKPLITHPFINFQCQTHTKK